MIDDQKLDAMSVAQLRAEYNRIRDRVRKQITRARSTNAEELEIVRATTLRPAGKNANAETLKRLIKHADDISYTKNVLAQVKPGIESFAGQITGMAHAGYGKSTSTWYKNLTTEQYQAVNDVIRAGHQSSGDDFMYRMARAAQRTKTYVIDSFEKFMSLAETALNTKIDEKKTDNDFLQFVKWDIDNYE